MNQVLLANLERIARNAGEKILHVYRSSFEVNEKSDGSPVTQADLIADAYIHEELMSIDDSIPLLTEERKTVDFSVRQGWDEYWLVDPLDGTRSFTERKGQFTVNIALIRSNSPVLGVVHAPLCDLTYLANIEKGEAWQIKSGHRTQLKTRNLVPDALKVLASKNHRLPKDEAFLARLQNDFPSMQFDSGSSSLKFCMIASGEADLYPRFQHTYEWDLGAAHAVLLAAGGDIFNVDGTFYRYNVKEQLLNNAFFAVGDTSICWREYLVSTLNRVK